VMDGASQWMPESGAPQGAVLSPLLSNVYLDPLDHLVAQAGFEMVRYADDFVILCRTAAAAAEALDLVRRWVADEGLTLHPEKTRIVDVRQDGFEFLGYRFEGQKRWPRTKSVKKLKDSLRSKTRRTSGQSLSSIIANVNRTLRGWFAYFQHSSRRALYKDLDGWLRMRLRSLLRRRQGGRGVARSASASFTWPNRFFAAQGLFSLASAHVAVCQSSRR
jgi:RNA-directed DNA polymerase